MDNLERNLDLILVTYKGKLADNFSVISAQNKMTSSLFYLLGKKCYLFDLSIYKFFMSCYVMLCYVMLCYFVLCYVILCDVMLCYVMLCYVILCYVMLCYVMSCYVMLCYVMLCCVM